MIHDLPKNLVEDSRKLLQQGADYEKFFRERETQEVWCKLTSRFQIRRRQEEVLRLHR